MVSSISIATVQGFGFRVWVSSGFCVKMLGTGLQFGKSGGDDRFYDPVKARKNRLNQQSQEDQLRRTQSDVEESRDEAVIALAVERVVPPLCNLEWFLVSITRLFLLSMPLRQPGEDSYGDDFRDTSSDISSDSEHERCFNYSRERNHRHLRSEVPLRMDRLSSTGQHSPLQEGFSSDEGEFGSTEGCLLFEHLEHNQPYCREPLADKVAKVLRPQL